MLGPSRRRINPAECSSPPLSNAGRNPSPEAILRTAPAKAESGPTLTRPTPAESDRRLWTWQTAATARATSCRRHTEKLLLAPHEERLESIARQFANS